MYMTANELNARAVEMVNEGTVAPARVGMMKTYREVPLTNLAKRVEDKTDGNFTTRAVTTAEGCVVVLVNPDAAEKYDQETLDVDWAKAEGEEVSKEAEAAVAKKKAASKAKAEEKAKKPPTKQAAAKAKADAKAEKAKTAAKPRARKK